VSYATSRGTARRRSNSAQRLDNILQDAGIKLSSVATDMLGKSGRAMLDTLVAGGRDPQTLAELACGRLRGKLPALRAAVTGRFSAHHGLIVGQILAKLDYLDGTIGRISAQIDRVIAPFAAQVELRDCIPGVDRRAAQSLIAEVGVDMDRFGSAARLASWAGVCPGHHESAGKSKSGKIRKGSKWLHSHLNQAAKAAARTKGRRPATVRRDVRFQVDGHEFRYGFDKKALADGFAELLEEHFALGCQFDPGARRFIPPEARDEQSPTFVEHAGDHYRRKWPTWAPSRRRDAQWALARACLHLVEPTAPDLKAEQRVEADTYLRRAVLVPEPPDHLPQNDQQWERWFARWSLRLRAITDEHLHAFLEAVGTTALDGSRRVLAPQQRRHDPLGVHRSS
jgi:hypothetical protein